MLRRKESCGICEYQLVGIGGWRTFMPILCCETKRQKRVSHGKKIEEGLDL